MWLGIVQLLYFVASLVLLAAARSGGRWPARVGVGIGTAGVVVHLGFITERAIVARRVPFTNTFETLVLFALLVMLLALAAHRRYGTLVLTGFASLCAALVVAGSTLLNSDIEPLLPSLKSNWLLFHVLVCFLGYAAFAVAFISASMYLITDVGVPRRLGLLGRERSEEVGEFLAWFMHRVIAGGFPLLTLGIVTGSVWANSTWGRWWNWDPKEAWSFVTWLIYAACLHLRFTRTSARLTALLTVLGFASVAFTYLGVNYWLAGLHGYG